MPRKQKDKDGDYNKVFPVRLRESLRINDKTQQNLADYLGKSRQAVSYYCDGSSSPDWETITKIAGFFEYSTDYLLGLTNDPFPEKTGVADLYKLSHETIINIDCLADDHESLLPLLNTKGFSDVLYILDGAIERKEILLSNLQSDDASDKSGFFDEYGSFMRRQDRIIDRIRIGQIDDNLSPISVKYSDVYKSTLAQAAAKIYDEIIGDLEDLEFMVSKNRDSFIVEMFAEIITRYGGDHIKMRNRAFWLIRDLIERAYYSASECRKIIEDFRKTYPKYEEYYMDLLDVVSLYEGPVDEDMNYTGEEEPATDSQEGKQTAEPPPVER